MRRSIATSSVMSAATVQAEHVLDLDPEASEGDESRRSLAVVALGKSMARCRVAKRHSSPTLEGALLDGEHAARYLGTSERHLRRLWQERRIVAVKVGRRVRFARRDLDAFIERNRHDALR